VGPRAILDVVVKRKIPSPHQELNPRTPIVQSIAQRYTEIRVINFATSENLIVRTTTFQYYNIHKYTLSPSVGRTQQSH
jgi:hypothetical protein